MAVYSFICSNPSCNTNVFEDRCSIAEYTGLAHCPECGVSSDQRDFEADFPHFDVRLAESEISKIGHLAKRHGERMSVDEITVRENANRTKKEDLLPDEHFKVRRK
jgi:hypothetical protein